MLKTLRTLVKIQTELRLRGHELSLKEVVDEVKNIIADDLISDIVAPYVESLEFDEFEELYELASMDIEYIDEVWELLSIN